MAFLQMMKLLTLSDQFGKNNRLGAEAPRVRSLNTSLLVFRTASLAKVAA